MDLIIPDFIYPNKGIINQFENLNHLNFYKFSGGFLFYQFVKIPVNFTRTIAYCKG